MKSYVQFADDKERSIIATFSSPQHPDDYQNYADIEDTDPRLTEYLKRSGQCVISGEEISVADDARQYDKSTDIEWHEKPQPQ